MAQTAVEQLEQYKQRVERLNARRTRVQVQLEAARQQYAEAVREATANYATADLAQLKALLMRREDENTKALADFVRAVDEFEAFITRIEEALANPQLLAAMVAEMPALAPLPEPVAAPAAPAAAVAFYGEDI